MKTKYDIDPYISLTNKFEDMKLICKMRIRDHSLEIGRSDTTKI
jgi:hypothetical protein